MSNVDPLRVATRTISGLYDGATTEELDRLSIRTAAELVAEEPEYGSSNPFAFMELQDVQELSNFFERRVSAYQVAVSGTVNFNEDF